MLLLAGVMVGGTEGRPMTAYTLAQYVGMPHPTVFRRLPVLAARGLVQKLDGGEYVTGQALARDRVGRALGAVARRVAAAGALVS